MANEKSSPHAQVTDSADVALTTGSFAYNIASIPEKVKMANEKRLIEIKLTAEELKDIIHGLNMIIGRCCELYEEEPYLMLIEKLKNAPTVDAVEVVRCEDCKYYLTDTLYCQEHKTGYCTMDDVIKDKTHFCSYGERRDDV